MHSIDGDTGHHDFDDEETNKIDNSGASSVLAEQATTEQPMLPTANFIRMAHQAAMQPSFVLPTMMPTVMLPPMITLKPLKNGWGMATGHHNNCNQSQQKTKRKRSRRSCKCGDSKCNGGFNRAWCKMKANTKQTMPLLLVFSLFFFFLFSQVFFFFVLDAAASLAVAGRRCLFLSLSPLFPMFK